MKYRYLMFIVILLCTYSVSGLKSNSPDLINRNVCSKYELAYANNDGSITKIECFDTYLNNEKIEKREEKTFHFIQNIMKEFTDEKSVENFKQEIIKRIKQLAKLSSESLIELVNDWFDNNHFLILEKSILPNFIILPFNN